MPKSAFLDVFDLRPVAKTSRLRCGALQTRGVPAILFGVAAVVLAAGASRALEKSVTLLPESLREARVLWLAVRAARPELTS